MVAVDYFTKWAKVEPLVTIFEANITNFVWTNIVCLFGIPYAIVTDNGKQFDHARFKDFAPSSVSNISSPFQLIHLQTVRSKL